MPNQKPRPQRFQLSARLIGKGFFICPHCGHETRISLGPTSKWIVRCKNSGCHASFRIGLVFYPQPPGRSGRPPDIHPAMQDATLLTKRYRRGDRVHQVVEEGGEPS